MTFFHFSLVLALTCSEVVSFRVSKNEDGEQRRIEEQNILRHEQYFEKIFAGDANENWVEFLQVNSYVNTHSTWQTFELKNRAEILSQKTLDYLRENSGYGEVLRKQILELEQKRTEERTTTYFDELARLFSLSKHVSTLENVRLLTSLLENDLGTFENGKLNRPLTEENASIAGWAASTLASLEIASAPTQQVPGYPDLDVPMWKQWWQEILSGERTFSFKGDIRDYNHLGVVQTNKVAPSKNTKSKKNSIAKGDPEPQNSSWLCLILITLIFGTLAIQIRNTRKRSYDK